MSYKLFYATLLKRSNFGIEGQTMHLQICDDDDDPHTLLVGNKMRHFAGQYLAAICKLVCMKIRRRKGACCGLIIVSLFSVESNPPNSCE